MTDNIRKIVKEGYERGDYVGQFRRRSDPNDMEKKYLDLLVAHLPKAAKILDLGCGIGVPFDKYLVAKGFQVTGVDFSPKHIEAAKQNVPNATFIEADFSTKDFGNERFYAVIALYSIFHIPREEQQELFNRMNALLEDDGLFLVTLGTSDSDGVEADWTGAPMAWSNYNPGKYRTMLGLAGFDIIESKYEGQPGDDEYHWWVLAKSITSKETR